MISGETAGIKSAYPYGRSGSEWAIRTVESEVTRGAIRAAIRTAENIFTGVR